MNLLTVNLLVWIPISTTACQNILIKLKHKWAKDLPHTKKELWFQSTTCHTEVQYASVWFMVSPERKSTLLLTVVKKEIKLCWESPIQFTAPLWIWVTRKANRIAVMNLLKNSTLPWKHFLHTNNSPYRIWCHILVTLWQLSITAIFSDGKYESIYQLLTEGLAKLRSNLMALCSKDKVKACTRNTLINMVCGSGT